jgi:4-hydroxythreonine-4-phosphate dehydrogenase
MKIEKSEGRVKVGITQGDINGIGYEIILKTLLDHDIYAKCIPVVYGSPKVASYHKKALNISNFVFNNVRSPEEAQLNKSNLINCIDDNARVELGKSSPYAGYASFKSLEKAVDDLKNGKIDVIVTAPINKQNIQSSEFNFPGHTEYLAKNFNIEDFVMLMVGEQLRVGVVTGHIPISKVAASITFESIIKKLRILNKSLIEDFGVRKPVIAVLGLNPHAGDTGLIGEEEQKIIIPAIQKARDENILAMGPYAADGFFGSSGFLKFDAILAMYHDQGLIPFKVLNFEDGVNYTAGLPVIRTSPAHGTAYEIAGKNEASAIPFRKAIDLACKIFNNRKFYNQMLATGIKTETKITGEDSDIEKLLEQNILKENDFIGDADFLADGDPI